MPRPGGSRPPLNPLDTSYLPRMLSQLSEEFGADAAWFLRLVRPSAGGARYLVDLHMRGPEAWQQLMRRIEHQDMRSWAISIGDLASLNKVDLRKVDHVPPAVRDAFWTPFGMQQAMVFNVSRKGHLLGNVALLRTGQRPPYVSRDIRRLNARVPALRDEIATRAALRAAIPPEDAAWVCHPARGTLYASPGTTIPGLLEEAVTAWLAASPREATITHMGRHRLQATPLEGTADGSWLVEASPTFTIEVPEAMHLTPVKRTVADLAAHGATTQEIGDHLGRSAETVRAHLRDIYRQLGVSNRVELRDALGKEWAI